jgi:hypothetical protein
MKLREQAKAAMTDVSDASKQVIETTEWATVALVAVAAVSLLALFVGTAAYIHAGHRGCGHGA